MKVGGGRREAGGERREARDESWEAGGEKPEAGGGRRETGAEANVVVASRRQDSKVERNGEADVLDAIRHILKRKYCY